MLALRGVGVLVTRPPHQVLPLCRVLESAGAHTVRLPVLHIAAVDDISSLQSRLGGLEGFELVVFTSANAVRFGGHLLDPARNIPVAAIGPATAGALESQGHRVTLVPAAGFDSESLLEDPLLAHLNGRRILIIKGRQGRQLLEEEFVRRGARVVLAEVYQRVRAAPSAAELAVIAERFASRDLQIVTATSAAIASDLLELSSPVLRRELECAKWVVPSARVADVVRARISGVSILRAATAADQDLLAAIVRWRATLSGA